MAIKSDGQGHGLNTPKSLWRVRGIFRGLAAIFTIFGVLGFVVVLAGRPFERNPLDLLLVALGCYTAHLVIEFLLGLDERIRYMEIMQQQQNKVLAELHRDSKASESVETLPYR